MTRKILATSMLGAALVISTGAAAQAAEDAYPPVAPTSSSTESTAPARVAPSTSNQQSDTDVLGTKIEAQTDSSTLPRTGAEWMATAALGAGLLVGGTGLVVASRRRQGA